MMWSVLEKSLLVPSSAAVFNAMMCLIRKNDL